jgi:4-diphosphocytidyl-2-C-methyl-D-erythritol kinase
MNTEPRNPRPPPGLAASPPADTRAAALRGLPAPAKLNLFLHVTGRRADGYHLLETVFDLVELADRIDLTLRDDGQVLLADPLPGVPPEHDLTVRAARLLAEHTGCRLGVTIALTKVIPIGGGLGGGSSDAATVLLGLNRLWGLDLPAGRLAELSVRLGADVPVFVGRQAAYATGIGDALQPLELPPRHYVIVAPPVQVPTADVFRDPELTRNTKPLKIAGLSRGHRVFDGRNDLQPVVLRRFAPVALALRALTRAAVEAGIAPDDARMTGSGACVFLPLEAESQARAVADRLDGRVPGRVLVTRSLIDHPLRDRQVS